MPAISAFYGILIQMHHNDHAPPHFHAAYAEHECQVDIRALKIIHGKFPRRAFALVKTWAEQHQSELLETGVMQKTHSPPDYSAPAMIPPIVSSAIPWKVKDVAVVGERRLHVRFNDGTEGDVDLSGFLKRGDEYLGVFAPLRDPAFFARVGLCYGAVTWPGEIDLAPDNMYRIIKKHGEYRL